MKEKMIPVRTSPEDLIPNSILMFPTEEEKVRISKNAEFEITCGGNGIRKLPITNLQITK